MGQADAINQAFEKCKGEIVCFINSDDILMPNAVQTAVTCFEINSGIAMVHGNCSTIDENGNETIKKDDKNLSKWFNRLKKIN